jgi:hypothetical protein
LGRCGGGGGGGSGEWATDRGAECSVEKSQGASKLKQKFSNGGGVLIWIKVCARKKVHLKVTF